MRAMVLREFNKPLMLEEVRIPGVGAEEVLVRVKACGVCQTDLKIFGGQVPAVRLPHIMGHEVAGEVADCGVAVKNVKAGDNVLLYHNIPCGSCYYCSSNRENICSNLQKGIGYGRIGVEMNGAYAEYVKAPARNAFLIPKGIGFEGAAILTDAVAVGLRATIDRGRVRPGDSVVIMGIGGVGIHAIQVAKSLGARVIAVDINNEKLRAGKEFGADEIVNSEIRDWSDQIGIFTDGQGADVVIDCVGVSETLKAGLEIVRAGGRIVIVGYRYNETFPVPQQRMVSRELEIVGTRGCTRQNLEHVIELIRDKKITPVVSKTFPLGEANSLLQLLKENSFIGRAVLIP